MNQHDADEYLDENMIGVVRDAVLAIDTAIAALIPRDVEEPHLQDARCLITSVLIHACDITCFLAAARTGSDITIDSCLKMMHRIQAAFGAPGDWGYGQPLGEALRRLYSVRLPIPARASTCSDSAIEAGGITC